MSMKERDESLQHTGDLNLSERRGDLEKKSWLKTYI